MTGPVTKLLTLARRWLHHPERWTQGAWARDENNQPVIPVSICATKWCSLGAIRKKCPKYRPNLAYKAEEFLKAELTELGFDEGFTYEQIRDAFKRAIEQAEKLGV